MRSGGGCSTSRGFPQPLLRAEWASIPQSAAAARHRGSTPALGATPPCYTFWPRETQLITRPPAAPRSPGQEHPTSQSMVLEHPSEQAEQAAGPGSPGRRGLHVLLCVPETVSESHKLSTKHIPGRSWKGFAVRFTERPGRSPCVRQPSLLVLSPGCRQHPPAALCPPCGAAASAHRLRSCQQRRRPLRLLRRENVVSEYKFLPLSGFPVPSSSHPPHPHPPVYLYAL